ncbi:MAG: methionyl-tRNA formyltransferase [Proteobacteria bacterium]|nr:MAG: methionyl-tRNA formyltransferase [Pseudomonadota bacterium]
MSRRSLKVIFFGTPDFAVPALTSLINGPDTVVAVVTRPDRPKGRGRKTSSPPVRLLAQEHHIPVLQPTKITTGAFAASLAAFQPDIIIVAAYGRVLPPAILECAAHGCINIHGSLLPRHRGAAPIQWSLIHGDKEVGVTIMQMDEGLDTGDILMKKAFAPDPGETAGTLFTKIAHVGGEAMMETLDMLETGGIKAVEQDHSRATYAPLLSKEDGRLDWSRPAVELDCLIRGVDPWPTAFSLLDGRKLQLFKPEVVYRQNDAPAGTVIRADREGLLISTGAFCLLVTEVKPEGRKRMRVESFLNGCPIKAGTILSSGKT